MFLNGITQLIVSEYISHIKHKVIIKFLTESMGIFDL